jgi:L-alanine-DL-glutamate epimerase-like enolase superfamily enzyme
LKIERIETLQADAGGRTFDYLKVTADNGLVGWSEYNESFGGAGLPGVIDRLGSHLIGKDPRRYEAHVALLQALRRQAAGGLVQQAIAAIENALLDIKARALQVPVYELFGGPLRERIRLYWSHCGTYRVGPRARDLQVKPVNTLDDIVDLGKEVVLRGYSALKTNILLLGDGNPRGHTPGFARGDSFPELNPERYALNAIRDQLKAFREGAGKDVDILVDLNFNYKTEGFLKVARVMEPFDLFWVEIDTRDSRALRYIREHTTIPVATGECLFGRREYRPFFEHGAMDVIIVDVPWNGLAESLKVASMAECLRGERRAAQLLQPPGDDDERAPVRGGAQPADHGVRHRPAAVDERPGYGHARDPRRLPVPSVWRRLGHRGQRGRDPRASASSGGCCARAGAGGPLKQAVPAFSAAKGRRDPY